MSKEFKELLLHGYCLLFNHKRKTEVLFEENGVTFQRHYCERCNYPLPVKK